MNKIYNKPRNNNPNSETIAAMLEAIQLENNPNTKTYTVEEAIKELKKSKNNKLVLTLSRTGSHSDLFR